MRRRDFIAAIGGGAAWPLTARTQPQSPPVIGFLYTQSPNLVPEGLVAFRRGLAETGFYKGQNVSIEYRWAENQHDRLPRFAAELVQSKVAVIVAAGGSEAAIAAKSVAGSIPIVFVMGDGDPVRAGLVASLNRPGGTTTGAVLMMMELGSKRLDLLHKLTPRVNLIAMLTNPSNTDMADQVTEMEQAARTLGLRLLVLQATSTSAIDGAFAAVAREGAGALIVATDPYLAEEREQIITLAARYSLPAIYQQSNFATAGGLMTYSPNVPESYRQAGLYAGRILKGEKPGDLPVVRTTRFEFIINLKTAKALGVEIPPTLLAIADEVIE